VSVTIRNDRRENPYSQIDRAAINDPGLSLRATGLLAWVLAKPDDWRIDARHIATVKADGYKSVVSALRELRQAGYITRERVRDQGGRFVWETTVHETPRGVVHNPGVIHSPVRPQATMTPERTHGATSGNGATSQVASIDPKPSDGFGAPLQIRETDLPARARAKANPRPRPQDSSTAPAGYVHDPTPRPGHDPAACALCSDHPGRPAPATSRRAWREAVGRPNDWPNEAADAPPGDAEAERARQQQVLVELIERGGEPR
jgi:hypothetical protein